MAAPSSSASSAEPTSLKERYVLLKRTLKEVLLENEVVKEELRRSQSRFMQVAKERTFLLEKLMAHCKPSDLESSDEEVSRPVASEAARQRLSAGAPSRTAPAGRQYPPGHARQYSAPAQEAPARKRARVQQEQPAAYPRQYPPPASKKSAVGRAPAPQYSSDEDSAGDYESPYAGSGATSRSPYATAANSRRPPGDYEYSGAGAAKARRPPGDYEYGGATAHSRRHPGDYEYPGSGAGGGGGGNHSRSRISADSDDDDSRRYVRKPLNSAYM